MAPATEVNQMYNADDEEVVRKNTSSASVVAKNVRQLAFQTGHHEVEFTQGDALSALFKTKQRGRRKPRSLREGLVRHLPPLLLQKRG